MRGDSDGWIRLVRMVLFISARVSGVCSVYVVR